MQNTKTRFFLLMVFIISLLLILVVIKVFEKRIQKIEKQEPGSITGKLTTGIIHNQNKVYEENSEIVLAYRVHDAYPASGKTHYQ